jgi:hypothetical protein
MNKAKLTPEHESILRTQVFDATHPGTLLHDFALVLEYVGEKGVKAAGKYNLLPITAVHPLDAQLARPLRLHLKRPQLRSHPYLQGLHLLLRASELGRVEGKGDKARLVIDADVFQSWNQLNPTEQYFSLLEAWLLESSPEMVGMRDGHDGTVLDGWLESLRMVTALGVETQRSPYLGWALTKFEEVYNGALADLFGLVSINEPLRAEQGYRPANATITPFGEAMLALLGTAREKLVKQQKEEQPDDSDLEVPGSRLRPIFQPYFHAWQKELAPAPITEAQEGVYVYKVSLGKLWRRIAMRHDQTLHDLLEMILRSIHFDDDHLYYFEYRDPLGRIVKATHPYCDFGIPADTMAVSELPIDPGDSMSLLYDFGDEWPFKVELERIDPPGSVKKLPKLLESHGKAPQQYPDPDW